MDPRHLGPTAFPVAGGAERDRTADLLIANEALSQLSYGPKSPSAAVLVSGARVCMGAAI